MAHSARLLLRRQDARRRLERGLQEVRAAVAVRRPSRSDLGYLIALTGGELVVGHSYLTGAGDEPTDTPVQVGMLGADYVVENGHYRIKHILSGENWNPELRAPLSAPGVQVAEGDYILEVNGRPLALADEHLQRRSRARRIIRRPFASTRRRRCDGSRLVTVVPVASEDALRSRAWVEHNRHVVDSLSHGKLAYVWLPNTGGGGYTYFTRYYYAQQEKEGAVIDERYNQGGQVADYIVNELDRKPMGYFAQRDGKISTSPTAGIFGPKVMIINESAGSGGDALPYYFKLRKIGPLVGTRTWGGLVGTLGVPPTIDGGGITAPSLAFYNLKGKWAVENEGVTPDVEVEYTAADVIKGHDPQLERAVQEALKLVDRDALHRAARPAPIDRTKRRDARCHPEPGRCHPECKRGICSCVVLFFATRAAAQIPSSIEFRVPKPPTVAVNDSGGVLVYELHVTNLTTAPVKLTRVDVLDPSNTVISSLADSALIRAVARPGLPPRAPEPTTIGAGLRAIVYFWVHVDPNRPPASVRQRLSIARGRRGLGQRDTRGRSRSRHAARGRDRAAVHRAVARGERPVADVRSPAARARAERAACQRAANGDRLLQGRQHGQELFGRSHEEQQLLRVRHARSAPSRTASSSRRRTAFPRTCPANCRP